MQNYKCYIIILYGVEVLNEKLLPVYVAKKYKLLLRQDTPV